MVLTPNSVHYLFQYSILKASLISRKPLSRPKTFNRIMKFCPATYAIFCVLWDMLSPFSLLTSTHHSLLLTTAGLYITAGNFVVVWARAVSLITVTLNEYKGVEIITNRYASAAMKFCSSFEWLQQCLDHLARWFNCEAFTILQTEVIYSNFSVYLWLLFLSILISCYLLCHILVKIFTLTISLFGKILDSIFVHDFPN